VPGSGAPKQDPCQTARRGPPPEPRTGRMMGSSSDKINEDRQKSSYARQPVRSSLPACCRDAKRATQSRASRRAKWFARDRNVAKCQTSFGEVRLPPKALARAPARRRPTSAPWRADGELSEDSRPVRYWHFAELERLLNDAGEGLVQTRGVATGPDLEAREDVGQVPAVRESLARSPELWSADPCSPHR